MAQTSHRSPLFSTLQELNNNNSGGVPAKEGGKDHHDDGDKGQGAEKENRPAGRKHASTDGNPGGKKQSSKGKGKVRGGVKGSKASCLSPSAPFAADGEEDEEILKVVAGKQAKKSAGATKEGEQVGKVKAASRNRIVKKEVWRKGTLSDRDHDHVNGWCRLVSLQNVVGCVS